MEFLNTILSLLLFLVALGVLITIHELGHFIAAKSFKVYCSDFSIGFGPKILNIKRKTGETTFKLGILPVGGYVSMYGEGIELPNGVNIPKTRSLEGISRWKRVIIMGAGIFMNFILAYIIFFICASCFPQYDIPYANVINVTNNEVYTTNKVLTDDIGNVISLDSNKKYIVATNTFVTFDAEGKANKQFPLIVKEFDATTNTYKDSVITHTDEQGNTYHYVLGINQALTSIYNLDEFSKMISLYSAVPYENVKFAAGQNDNGELIFQETGSLYLPEVKDGKLITYQFNKDIVFDYNYKISIKDVNDESKDGFINANLHLTNKTNKTSLDEFGFGINYSKYWNGWNSFKVAGEDWARSTTLIAKALGGLFIGQGWDQMGGPVAIFTQTTSILQNNPFNFYLQTWGIISVNLALFNLLPFPGLDGWQILVTLIEGGVNTFKKTKYKTKKENREIDSKLLKDLETKETAINDIYTAYENKLNKKFNPSELSLKYANVDETVNEPDFEFYKQYINLVEERDNFKKANNIEQVEAYKEWKIPEKIKNIVSYVGLALLFGLMFIILIKDVVGLF